jgi:uncharacterized protein HemY
MQTEDAAQAVRYCTTATELIADDMDVLCDRAEAHIMNGEYDQAANDYNKVLQDNQNHQRVCVRCLRTPPPGPPTLFPG